MPLINYFLPALPPARRITQIAHMRALARKVDAEEQPAARDPVVCPARGVALQVGWRAPARRGDDVGLPGVVVSRCGAGVAADRWEGAEEAELSEATGAGRGNV